MSAIFGFCSFNDLPESHIEQRIRKMKAALGLWASDGFKTKIKNSAGFGIAVQTLREIDQHLPPPIFVKNRSVLFSAAARLDNRKELIDGSESKHQTTHDSELVRKQYLKHGSSVSQLLMGDWAFAAFDTKRNKFDLVRDPLGNTALYYTVNQSFFAFAPTPHALLVLDDVSEQLDEWKLACEICRFPHSESADRTKWKDVRQLLPSHKLTVQADQASVSVDRYWSLNDIAPVRLNSEEEYYEQFRELMSRAVSSRMDGYRKVGSTLSSGYDSGTVTAFAAKLLAEKNRPLIAYTSIPRYKEIKNIHDSRVDEWPVAHSHTQVYPNIEHTPVDGSRSAPHHVLKKIALEHGETVFTPGNAFWIDAILQRAHADNVQALLTGQMGNAGISWNGSRNQILYQFLEGHWGRGVKSLKEFKSTYDVHWYKILKYFFLWQFLSPIKKSLKRLIDSDQLPWVYSSPINQEFAKRLKLHSAIRKSSLFGYKHTLAHPRQKRTQIMEINAPISCATWHRKGTYHNLDVLDPTTDIRLLEFCFGIPDDLHSKGDMQRLLIKKSLKDILPDDVIKNKYKGKQAADIGHRLLDYKKELKSEIDFISTSPAAQEYLNISSLYDSLDHLSTDLPYSKSYQHSSRLLSGLMFGYFLEKYG
ncbi:MAG: hypothetical protein GVY20_03070 [Bacteroidetes bacterium]|jgi:asparagine synthase (glutamine-hydrolysing)|nr:hypothetical protein [Bacteroidota bacterium]